MMKMLAVPIAALAALASLSIAGTTTPKTYTITLSSAARVGGNELAPGDYRLAVDTALVRLVEVKTGKSFEVAAKVETGEKKFEGTAITTQNVSGIAEIREIRLGGTKIQIDFR